MILQIKDFKLKQSWKRVYAKDSREDVGTLRTYHMNNEEETEVEKEDMVEGRSKNGMMVEGRSKNGMMVEGR